MGRPVLAGAAALAALALAAGACDESSTEPAGDEAGTSLPNQSLVSVWLTDAPGDIVEAWIQIDAIYLQGREDEGADGDDSNGNGNGDGNGNGNGGQAGRAFLLEDPTGWINLMELDGETLTLVEGVLVPAGTYPQLRFVLGEALLLTEGGTVYATSGADLEALNTLREGLDPELEPLDGVDGILHCPSCSQSGLKVKLPDVGLDIDGESEIILLDFDASQSFGHVAGRSGRWVMHPVIFATEAGAEPAESATGGIAGSVVLDDGATLPECGGGAVEITIFVPVARMGTTELTTSVDGDGNFAFEDVPTGDWEMDYTATFDFGNGDQLILEATADPANVTLDPDETESVDYTITSAECDTGE